MHVAIVVNTLLSRGLSLDGEALQEVLGILQQDQWPAVLQYRNKGREDAVEAYHRAGLTLQSLVDAAAESDASTTMATLFTLNGLHSFERDVTHGFSENGRVGLALATATSKQGNSQSWTNAYTTWQLAHLIGSEPLYQLPQVLVPSVTCPSATAVPSTAVFNYPLWLQNHILATSLNRMLVPEMDASDGSSGTSSSSSSVDVNELQDYIAQNDNGPYPLADRFDEAQTLGVINTEVVELSSPSRDYVERRLYDWCGEQCHRTAWNLNIDSFPISNLGNQGFRLYYSMFLWVTGVLAGLGSELFVCLLYLRTWSPERELWLRYVQLLFPLVVTTAVGLASQRNFLALTFVVFGLWKFGFPETIMYFYDGFFDVKASRLLRTADILNGLGTIMHHTIVVWYVAMQLGGVFGVDRYILTTATVPLMQHWFPLVAYANTNLYAVIQISLEVYFEWSVFSYMDHFYNYHGLALAIVPGVLVVAHWFYLAAAVIELIAPELVEDEDEDGDDNLSVSTNNTPFRNVHTRGVEVFVRQHNISCHSSNHSLGSEGHVNGSSSRPMEITTTIATSSLEGKRRSMSEGDLKKAVEASSTTTMSTFDIGHSATTETLRDEPSMGSSSQPLNGKVNTGSRALDREISSLTMTSGGGGCDNQSFSSILKNRESTASSTQIRGNAGDGGGRDAESHGGDTGTPPDEQVNGTGMAGRLSSSSMPTSSINTVKSSIVTETIQEESSEPLEDQIHVPSNVNGGADSNNVNGGRRTKRLRMGWW